MLGPRIAGERLLKQLKHNSCEGKYGFLLAVEGDLDGIEQQTVDHFGYTLRFPGLVPPLIAALALLPP